MKDKLNITIRIATQPPIPLTIERDEEELIRRAESSVNRLWNSWSQRFNTTESSMLAMVAFQFAKLYTMQLHDLNSATEILKNLDQHMDKLLADNDPEGSKP